jgi:hypothetical protein
MLRSRSALVALVAFAAVVAGAAPALAHEEINPKTFPTGQPTFFNLYAANERTVNLVKIVLHAPKGTPFGASTRSPAGWTAARTDDTITWTGGAVKPETFETWGYEIEGADQPGALAYTVTLGFADGNADDVEVDVTALAAGGTGVGAVGAPSATTVTTGATATTATTAGAAAAADKGGESDASGTAKAALAVAIVALLVAAGALAVGARRRGGPGAAGGGPSGSGTGPGAAQDW